MKRPAWTRIASRTAEVPCHIDIARTAESFHAHVDLDGFMAEPGDEVLVHDAPLDVAAGAHIALERRATVVRAGWLERMCARFMSRFEILHLFEVGFSSTRLTTAQAAQPRGKASITATPEAPQPAPLHPTGRPSAARLYATIE